MNLHEPIAAVDASLFRRVMSRFATVVTVITAEAEGRVRGMTANAFMSGSVSPPLCVISVAVKAHMHGYLVGAERFGVNILAESQEALGTHFAGHSVDQVNVEFERAGDVPLLKHASAVIAAELEARYDCGDHTLFVGRIFFMRDHGRAAGLSRRPLRLVRLLGPGGERADHRVLVRRSKIVAGRSSSARTACSLSPLGRGLG